MDSDEEEVLYTEEIIRDLQDLVGSWDNEMLDYHPSKWSKEQLITLNDMLSDFVTMDKWTPTNLAKLATDLGKMSRNLNLTGGSTTHSTLQHCLGLFQYALHLVEDGCTVHLLEGVNSSGYQLVGDVDLVYSDGPDTYAVDYTNMPNLHLGEIKVHSRPSKRDKYAKLDSKRELEGTIKRVVSMGTYQIPLVPIECPVYKNSPREDDFKFNDSLIAATRGTELSDARRMLNRYSELVEVLAETEGKKIEQPGTYASDSLCEEMLVSAGMNCPNSVRVYEEFLDSLEEHIDKHPDSENNIRKFYSLDFQKQMNVKTKPHIPLADCVRGFHQRDPFERLFLIRKLNEESGIITDCFTAAISNLHLKDEVIVDVDYSGLPGYTTLKNTRFMRPKGHDGELSKVFKVMFPKGVSYNSWANQIKLSVPNIATAESFANLEDKLNRSATYMYGPGSGSMMYDEIHQMTQDCTPKYSALSKENQKIMSVTSRTLARTQIMSQLAFLQETTYAILSAARKTRISRGSQGSYTSQHITFSIEGVSDRGAVVWNNIGPVMPANRDTIRYQVYQLTPVGSEFVMPYYGASTRVLSMSLAQQDWNVTIAHKALSWVSLYIENNISNSVNKSVTVPKLPLLLMFLNSNKFAQASEMVRYLFVNGVSLTSGPRPLYEKLAWYVPKTHVERLYMMRLCRMADTLNLAKSRNAISSLKKKYQSRIVEPDRLNMTVPLKEWTIAMPDEDVSSLNEQQVYNSFYVCKTLAIQRYEKTMSEALVLDKQLDAREAYLTIKRAMLPHESRFREPLSGPEQLYELVMNMAPEDLTGVCFSPDPIVNSLAVMSTSLLLAQKKDKTVGDALDRTNDSETVAWTMRIDGVMNSRGSVRSVGPHGLGVTHKAPVGNKLVKMHQNDKCYATILKALDDMINGKDPASVPDSWVGASTKTWDSDTEPDYEALSKLGNRLWPLVYEMCFKFAACVSKMVHKDQIGAREIAVLNAAARVMCRFVEMLSRSVRDMEHNRGVTMNLIERKDKRDIIMSTLGWSNAERKKGRVVMYDSADCSKWGPSMCCWFMYINLACRTNEGVIRTAVRNCLSLFSNKVFKIPDNFFEQLNIPSSKTTIIGKVKERLKAMSAEMGSLQDQIILLEDSMHQGILGCLSSLMGADAHNLSNYVLTRNLSYVDFSVRTHLTSDDYGRVLTWSRADLETSGVFRIGKDSLAQHVLVLRHCGIKRNLEKSGLSRDYWEFNSEFFVSSGEIRPDVKSRLSYIDYSRDTDPYPTAFRPAVQASEFLRSEGSYIGACWTFVLNNHLAMIQNQSRALYNKIGTDIYKVPLEFGGLIRPDPLAASISSHFLPILENYEPYSMAPARVTMRRIMDNQSLSPEEISVTEEGDLKVPSASRSSLIHLCRRPSRSSRAIREMLVKIPDDAFLDAYHSRFSGSLMACLMACAKRQERTDSIEGSSEAYMITQTRHEASLYSTNSAFMRERVGSGKVSRSDLHKLAMEFLDTRELVEPDNNTWTLNCESWDQSRNLLDNIYRNIQPLSAAAVPRKIITHQHRESFASRSFQDDMMLVYDALFRPVSLGGSCEAVSAYHYLESRNLYANRLRKMSMRNQHFRMALRTLDVGSKNLPELILTSNYCAGVRLSFTYDTRSVFVPDTMQEVSRLCLTELEYQTGSREGTVVPLLSDNLFSYFNRNLVSAVDITDFCNIMTTRRDVMNLNQDACLTLLDKLKTVSRSGNFDLVVNPRALSRNITRIEYRSTQGVKMWQEPILSDSTTAGRDIITNIGSKYIHHWNCLCQEVPPPPSGPKDEYKYMNYAMDKYITVDVDTYMGFTVLMERSSRYMLQLFSQVDHSYSKFRVYTKSPLEYDRALFKRMNLQKHDLHGDQFSVRVRAATELMGIEREEEDESSSEKSLRLHLAGREPDDDDSSDYSGFSQASCGFLSDESDDEEQEVPMWREETTGPSIAPVSQAEGSEDSESLYSEPMDHEQVIRPTFEMVESMVRATIVSLPDDMIESAAENTGEDLNYGYEFNLPINLPNTRFWDEDGRSGFDALLDTLEDVDNEEFYWIKGYLKATLLSYGPVVSKLRRSVRKSSMNSRW